ncbi:hypothetical protein [Streptomyces sp. NPDC096132]|uniref:hypothetical protein n=1 Tax=Streptomyces sp. NPDC096132 TaxID=3366075 RepID=UPI0037FD097A
MPERQNPFAGARITVASRLSERLVLRAGYPAQPGGRTKVEYFVDEALKEAGFKVRSALNPSGVKIVHEPDLRLLPGNGPQAIDQQAIDQQAEKLRSLLAADRPTARHARQQAA